MPADTRPIDLHCHSTCSDGTLTPTELVAEAQRAGLAALALTDHDTIAGWEEMAAAARAAGIEPVTGVELATYAEFPGQGRRRIDLLAYLFDPASGLLAARLEELRRARVDRNGVMLEKLAALGFHLTREEVRAVAGGDVVGRPHFAKVMVAKGYVRTTAEAFQKYIGDDGPGFVPKESLDTTEAIALAAAAGGGVCAVAHPGEFHTAKPATLRAFLAPLAEAGLVGVETYYPEHTPELTRVLEGVAKDLGLVCTGGSDFHGENRPGTRLGVGRGTLRVSYDVLTQLRARQPR